MTEYSTFEMLEVLSANRQLVFKRVGDEKFLVSSTIRGGIRMCVNNYKQSFTILNYLHEKWLIVKDGGVEIE